jgi:hypothetical protein
MNKQLNIIFFFTFFCTILSLISLIFIRNNRDTYFHEVKIIKKTVSFVEHEF